jgi:uncharacterized membrane protein (UPF0127 family)
MIRFLVKVGVFFLGIYILYSFWHYVAMTGLQSRVEQQITTSINGVELLTAVAQTPTEQQVGLGRRPGLAPNQAMLFPLPSPQPLSIWMKDMRFSIDILWLDQDGKVIYALQNVPPCQPDQPCTVYTPPQPANFVLEVPAGFIQDHGIELYNSQLQIVSPANY